MMSSIGYAKLLVYNFKRYCGFINTFPCSFNDRLRKRKRDADKEIVEKVDPI